MNRHGPEADRHLLRCLFSHVDFSGDGKSSGKDFHQVFGGIQRDLCYLFFCFVLLGMEAEILSILPQGTNTVWCKQMLTELVYLSLNYSINCIWCIGYVEMT